MSTGAFLMAQTSVIDSHSAGDSDEGPFGSWNPASRPERSPPDSAATGKASPPLTPPPSQQQHQQQPFTAEPQSQSQSEQQELHGSTADIPGLDVGLGPEPTLTTTTSTSPPFADGAQPTGQSTTFYQTQWSGGRDSPDLFAQLDSTARTNSFPDMDAIANLSAQQPQPEGSHSAAEPGNDERTALRRQPTADSVDGLTQHNADPMRLKRASVAGDPDDGYSFFDYMNAQTKPIYNPPEIESRFEEGVPLVNNSNPLSPVDGEDHGPLDEIFKQDEAVEDAGFFNSSTQPIEPSSPDAAQSLNRKSTAQVLDSLNIPGNADTTDSPTEAAAFFSSTHSDIGGAAHGDVPIAGEGPHQEATEDDLEERWKAALGEDDLLMDDDGELLPDTQSVPFEDHAADPSSAPVPTQNVDQANVPPSFTPIQQNDTAQAKPAQAIYTPHQPSSADLTSGLPAPAYTQPPQSRVSESPGEQPVSFSNQPKAGYQSPYDLPMDLRPKRSRAALHHAPAIPQPPAPPRSSSMLAGRPTSSSSAAPPPPPPPGPPASSLPHTADSVPSAAEKPATTPASFYEELPTTSRSRPSTRGRYTPQPAPPQPTEVAGTSAYPPSQPPTAPSDTPQLQGTEGTSPYSSLPVPPSQAVPAQSSRYSPKPTTSQAGPKPSTARYSPAPPPQAGSPNKYMSAPSNAPPSNNSLPFQPRTSSPLAQHEKDPLAAHTQPGRMDGTDSDIQTSVPASGARVPSDHLTPQIPSGTNRIEEYPVNPYFPAQSVPSQASAIAHATADANHPQQVGDHGASPYRPMSQSAPDSHVAAPRRSMTQSPGKAAYEPPYATVNHETVQRPASVDNTGPPLASPAFSARKAPSNTPQLELVAPTDGQEADHLERWKGAPIMKFGFGGTILTSFPQYIPRYATGQAIPKLKASSGDVKTRHFEAASQDSESSARFPGPLRSKSKKKDVITWLSAMITSFEENLRSGAGYGQQAPQQQEEEKALLWKVVRIMVEHDGALEGTPDVEKKVRTVLGTISEGSELPSQDAHIQANLSHPYGPITGAAQEESKSTHVLEGIRNHLLTGNREKAVWEAVDHRLWGHAMLLAATLEQSVWKQVSQEFIRREVKSVGDNTESLAALYEIFAGNLEESIDELVPLSARAGLQMMSKDAAAGPTKNTLDGLNKWRETLTLILNNRSPQHNQALLALSNLLASYGRIEASHICALFARSGPNPVFGGIQDQHSAIVLLGADHRNYPSTFMNDRILWRLSEVYEFATSVLAGSPSNVLPHLQPFKFQEAWVLAEEGRTSEAQDYCDSIGTILKSASKPSPYYHQTFCAALDELCNRLRQAPSDGSSSWISKPSIGKVSGSVWTTFTNFVTGEDSDAASTGSVKGADGEAGPFSRMVGTPPMSASPSATDSYFMHSQHHTAAVSSTSRYAPRNQSLSPDQSRGRRSLDSQRSPSLTTDARPHSQRRPSREPPAPSNYQNYQMPPSSVYIPSVVQPQQNQLLSPVEEAYSSQSVSVSNGSLAQSQESLVGAAYQPPQVSPQQGPPQVSVAPVQSSYGPQSGGGVYEPPSYEPGPLEAESSEGEKPKPSSFMADDEDDDVANRAEEVRKAEQDRKNRENADAVRKAAEEDAKKSQSAQNAGWFSWLRGAKKEPANAPIRAKLGEENSFYYDEELKRWVNKKDPSSSQSPAQATPPPPKGSAPPSRSVSSNAGPVPPPSASPAPSTGSGGDGLLAPPRSDSPHPTASPLAPSARPQAMTRSASAEVPADPRPISRSGPTLNNANSIDDLIGAPQARKANTVKPRKKGRGYVDVMAK